MPDSGTGRRDGAEQTGSGTGGQHGAGPTGPQLFPIEPDYADYLHDESRMTGQAETISFPRTEEELRDVLRGCAARGTPVTVQGGRTGITGGAVPQGGHVLNLSRMNRILGLRHNPVTRCWLLAAQPGVLLKELNEAVESKTFNTSEWTEESLAALGEFQRQGRFFFPPDPTETTASLGGMAATNASGARSYLYGPMRNYVEALRLVLADGSALALRRGTPRAQAGHFRLALDSGQVLEAELPRYLLPATKNAAGLYVQPEMDLLDLVVGSEGTLGVIAELELRLLPLPPRIWALLAFFPEEIGVVRFVHALSHKQGPQPAVGGASRADTIPSAPSPAASRPVALEFFDSRALELLRDQKQSNSALSDLPALPQGQVAAIYVEYHAAEERGMEEGILAAAETLERCGGSAELAWSAGQPREIERLKEFRHALPESVNLIIDQRKRLAPEITKLGTDMAVPDGALEEALLMYHRDLDASGLEYVMFGHIGNNHIHVNILPSSREEYAQGKDLIARWADVVISWGGTVSAEHGIGKLKVELLRQMYGEEGIAGMRRLIELFNPGFRLNRGNMVS